jgi:hypothetical protein
MFIVPDTDSSRTNKFSGRILSRLSKDQDTLDTELSSTLYQVGAIAAFNVLQALITFSVVPYGVQ